MNARWLPKIALLDSPRESVLSLGMRERYALVEDDDGTFAVVDARTYKVIERSGLIFESLSPAMAEGLIPLLNELDKHKEMPN
ncbi:hypothetical protein [Rhizobium sp. WW_1]|uniref:hypothetical protein n=1 Tax=Rhizobium sp. WW_1 TaxID=1907375 RepID=UPI000FEFA02A|nr:hypothetical protein [Rhizobium sp. WW_1]RKD61580.1 hypothetical protein BJ928_107181 [Rhizobium sp. WW_1]